MKKYLIVFLFIILPLIAFAVDGPLNVEHPAEVNTVAVPDKINGVSGIAGGGGYDYYYSADGVYGDGNGTITHSYYIGNEITITSGGTATEIGVLLTGSCEATSICLELANSSNAVLAECTVSSVSSPGWNSCTLSQSVSSSQVVKIAGSTAQYYTCQTDLDSGDDGFYDDTQMCADAPITTLVPTTDTGSGYPFRIKVEH